MIVVDRLSKTFGTHAALTEVTFTVHPGTVTGLLGRNGAGKSTCLRILAGVLRQTSGTVRVAGFDNRDCPEQLRAKTGYLPESAPLYPELRVNEYLAFRAELKGIPPKLRQSRIADLLKLVHAEELSRVRCGHLSRGYQKRVGLADALLSDPEVLLLDEPTAGLDPTQNRDTRQLLAELAKTRVVVVSSHALSEIEAISGSVLLIDHGQLVAAGTIDTLLALRQTEGIAATIRGNREQLEVVLASQTVPVHCRELGPDLFLLEATLPSTDTMDCFAETLSRSVIEAGLSLRAVQRKGRSLEDVFADITEGDKLP